MPEFESDEHPQAIVNTMSSSKDAKTGFYLSCNQAFAKFANRNAPEDVVGLTDYDIFDEATANCFVDNDRIALSMGEPYTFFEDVRDANGTSRHLHTTKQSIVDQAGTPYLICTAVDVSDLMRAKREHEETQVAFAEALNTSAIYESIVNALASNYFDLFYVNTETGSYVEFGSRTNKATETFGRRGSDFFE